MTPYEQPGTFLDKRDLESDNMQCDLLPNPCNPYGVQLLEEAEYNASMFASSLSQSAESSLALGQKLEKHVTKLKITEVNFDDLDMRNRYKS